MSNFEFIAVLLSIIFTLAIANLLSGMLQAFLKGELTDTRLAWSLSISRESTDSGCVVHSLDSPATLPVKSGLQVPF